MPGPHRYQAPDSGRIEDPRPYVRLAALLHAGITGGAIPPGTLLTRAALAREHGCAIATAGKALGVVEDAGLITRHNGRRYAAPAGPPSPRAAARLGAALSALRETAGLSPEALAATAGCSSAIIANAESGTWHARDFWHACDTALNAGGTLLKLHDTMYASARHYPGQDHEQDSGQGRGQRSRPRGPYHGMGKTRAQVAGEIAARVGSGDWPPGGKLPSLSTLATHHGTSASTVMNAIYDLADEDVITVTDHQYHVPGPAAQPATARTLAAVILIWDDGTRTTALIPPAPPVR